MTSCAWQHLPVGRQGKLFVGVKDIPTPNEEKGLQLGFAALCFAGQIAIYRSHACHTFCMRIGDRRLDQKLGHADQSERKTNTRRLNLTGLSHGVGDKKGPQQRSVC